MNEESEPIEPIQEHRKKQLELENLIEENRTLERLNKIKKLKERNARLRRELYGKKDDMIYCDDCHKLVHPSHFN